MPRPAYAPTSHYWDGYQSGVTGGLTYFPDSMTSPQPLGEYSQYIDEAGAAIGTVVGGPVGTAVGAQVGSVIQRWFGGSAVDQQRQERVNYVAQAAVNDNVNAMRIVLAAPNNVSGNERQMWVTAYDLIKQQNPDVVRRAEALGPYWMVNSGDTASNYPRLREYIRQGQSVVQQATGAISEFFNSSSGGAPSGASGPVVSAGGGVSPALLLSGAAVAAFVLFGRRR